CDGTGWPQCLKSFGKKGPSFQDPGHGVKGEVVWDLLQTLAWPRRSFPRQRLFFLRRILSRASPRRPTAVGDAISTNAPPRLFSERDPPEPDGSSLVSSPAMRKIRRGTPSSGQRGAF